MLSVKKMKPKKGKKKYLSKGEDKTIQSSPETPPESKKMSSLKQLFEARNASLKRKKDRLPEDDLDSTVKKSKKQKKRKEEAVEETPEKKEGKEDFPRGKAERQEQLERTKVVKSRNRTEEGRLGQTLFVGNLPLTTRRKDLEKMFCKFGILESVRLRGAIPVKTKISKRVADITRKFHEGLHSRKGFVVFKDTEGAEAALAMNGALIEGRHIIVDKASGFGQKKTYDDKKTIFVGNLPFDVDDEVVWNAFSSLGEVEAVRVVRDKTTGAGKGFGYVLFKTQSSHTAALEKEEVEIEGRNVRIKPVESKGKGTKEKKNKSGYGLSLKAKNRSENPQSRKSAKKLLKREKTKHQKKKVAQNFKQFF